MAEFRVETKQANSEIWNGECEIIEAKSALEAAAIMADYYLADCLVQHGGFYSNDWADKILNTTQFRVSNPNGYGWFGKIFNYSDLK